MDPHLHDILPSLVSAFLYYLCNLREQYFVQRKTGSEVIPLVRGLSKILYTLCKIRGTKIVSQFLNNEPRYLDPMHDAFQQWNRTQGADNNLSISSSESMTWEERYIMLIWLSHLMLSPFDLDSVSSLKVNTVADTWAINLPHETPLIARNIVFMCVHHLSFAGKEREASSRLLVRLVLRTDMSKIKLLDCIVGWASSLLQISPNVNPRPIYFYVGVLSFLSGVLHSADKAIVSPYLSIILSCTQAITAQKTILSKEICSSGLARKFIIKILRSVTLHNLQPHSPLSKSDPFNLAETILEDTVDQLLVFLSDKDTSVRLIASKSLSIIATKAEHMLASEIVEAIIESFDENLLWEGTGTSNQAGKPSRSLKRNLTAIDPLRWHGLVMTLSHLIYRRSPTVKQLPSILKMLIIALGFEQRSSKGGSIGASVRDAACYGIWALARRYTTEELLAVDSSNINAADHSFQPYSILQILSNEILVAATLDPAGNIRRGASAALQEMIGRHPDKIVEAISLVQIVDYYAISLRSRAMIEIAIAASSLHEAYRNVISNGLQAWRGIRSSDANSRRLAASAMGLIAVSSSQASFDTTISALLHSLSDIRDQQVEERHGLLLSLAAITRETSSNFNSNSDAVFFPALNIIEISEVFRFSCPLSERDFRALPLRPELTSEAACTLISAIAVHLLLIGIVPTYAKPSSLSDKLESFINILGWSLCRPEEIVIDISSKAVHNLMAVLTMEQRNCLVQSWIKRLESKDAKLASGQGKSLGHIAALGACFFSLFESEMVAPLQNLIISSLISQMKPHADVESRVAALRSLSSGILVHKSTMPQMYRFLD